MAYLQTGVAAKLASRTEWKTAVRIFIDVTMSQQ